MPFTNSMLLQGVHTRSLLVDAAGVDLFALFGSPSFAITYFLYISTGATISSPPLFGGASLDASGFDPASIGTWFVDGDIIGSGGDGGEGGGFTDPGLIFKAGGGGGGAGVPFGIGGFAFFPPATSGIGGTRLTAGAAGANSPELPSFALDSQLGAAGGHAILLNHPVTINLSGLIGGGGSGGDPGVIFNLVTIREPTAGTTLGVNGISRPAGFAVRYSESGNAVINLTGGGEVLGNIS